jgi:L-serine kinase (ADP)
MSVEPEFALVPIDSLRAHEEIDLADIDALIADLTARGVFTVPIWIARGSMVILNGHHRVAALRRLGATRVPAWILDYESNRVRLELWRPGASISKSEVIRRGLEGRLFPPKTTRHVIDGELPHHPTPLAALLDGRAPSR